MMQKLNILTFNTEIGKEIFWHSSAHLMAEAVSTLYPGAKIRCRTGIGETGFYYDIDLPEGV